jgi:hypothetical protein
MRWRKLTSWPEDELWRGTVLRLLKSEYPYETPVDFMLIESSTSPSGFTLVVTTGYKAGCTLWELPVTAKAKGEVRAISRSWLIENWKSHIYGACPTSSVRIITNYSPGVLSP